MIGFATVAAVIAAVFALVSYGRIADDVVSEREQVALRQAYANARIARSRLRVGDSDPGEVVASLVSRQGTPVVRYGGEWFAASVGVGPNDVPPGLLRLVAEGQSGHQRVRVDGDLTMVIGIPVAAFQGEYYEFVPISDVEATLSSVRRSLWLSAAVATLLGAVLGLAMSRAVLRPLRRVADAAGRVRTGDLRAHIETSGDRSLDPLSDAFNAMIDELRRRVDRDPRFAGDVTHELRGPLATLAIAVSHAKRHIDEPDRVRYALDTLDDTVDRFSGLVLDLLEMSRIEAGVAELNVEPIDVQAFVDAVVSSAEPDCRVRAVIEPNVPAFVVFDKRRIGQCVANLIQNAERYGGGAAELRVSCQGDALTMTVDDEGPGVPEEERSTIFERFARGQGASDVPGGTGLGLFLVAEHMRMHGGTATVGASPNGGASFALRFPLETP